MGCKPSKDGACACVPDAHCWEGDGKASLPKKGRQPPYFMPFDATEALGGPWPYSNHGKFYRMAQKANGG